MKKSRFLVFFGISIILISCDREKKNNLESKENYPIPITEEYSKVKSWNRFDSPEFGKLYDYYLKDPMIVQSIPCKGRFTVDSSGELYGFIFSEDYLFHGNMIPKGSRYEGRVHNNKRNGYMIFLSKDSEIQGLMVRSKGTALEDYKLDFYNNNMLRGFKLVSDTEIDGVPCKGGKKDYVILYPDGKLGECTLSKDFVSNDEAFLADCRIMVSKEGKVYKKDSSPFKIDFYMDLDE